MAKYGQNDFMISVGGTDMSSHVDTINGADIEALVQQTDGFGDTWMEQLYVGVRRMDPVVCEGFYDDVANGPSDVFSGSAIGSIVAVILTWGGAKTTSFNAVISSWGRNPGRGELHRFTATLTPTGVVVEA